MDRHEYACGTEEQGQSQTKYSLVTPPGGNSHEKTKTVLAYPELCIFVLGRGDCNKSEEADCHGETNQGILFLSRFWVMWKSCWGKCNFNSKGEAAILASWKGIYLQKMAVKN